METLTFKKVNPPRLHPQRIAVAKTAYTVRRVDQSVIATLLDGDVKPQAGDLVLARVVRLGQHKRLELVHGRRAPLFVGDEIIVCYGHRYAPDQFEAQVPEDLGPCHLAAAGGVAGRCLSWHDCLSGPTEIEPLGLLADNNGRVINIRDWALPSRQIRQPRPLVFAVVGTAMNAGKTTTAAYFIRGLLSSGMNVGAAKVTGTGAGGDMWLMKDAGAAPALDFVDAGYVSTYRAGVAEVQAIMSTLMGHLSAASVDAIVLEVADGVLQQETAALLRSEMFRRHVDGVLFAAGDAMGGVAGVEWLKQHELPVMGISGCLSASPLASREAQRVSGVPVVDLRQLETPDIFVDLFQHLDREVGSVAGVGV